MPTYNGERFLSQQVSSILEQEEVSISLYVRDDSSTDNTLEILKQFDTKISILESHENIGTARSLIVLLENCPDVDFLAFCDQDDHWNYNHLSDAIRHLKNSICDSPTLYFPLYAYIDETGKSIGKRRPRKHIGRANSLVENPAIGCGIVVNRKSIELIRRVKFNPKLHIDQQLYFLLSHCGEIVQGDSYNVFYRLHRNNQVGIRKQRNLYKLFKSLILDSHLRGNQIELWHFYLDNIDFFPIEARSFIEKHFTNTRGDIFTRILCSLNPTFQREKMLDQLAFKVLILLKKI
jgi:glycosyltransferase involved in cell wall biosynthesis